MNHEGHRHYRNPESFYSEGTVPILGLTYEEAHVTGHVFRPSDVSRKGLGGFILLEDLPEALQNADRIITVWNAEVIDEPLDNETFCQFTEAF